MEVCDPNDISLKSYFLGPESENQQWVVEEINALLKKYFAWRQTISAHDGKAILPEDQQTPEFQQKQQEFRHLLHSLVEKYEAEVPKFSPRYIGHMVSETSLPGLFGHIAALLHNPNNISDEVSVVGAAIEEEAIQEIGRMIGYDPVSVCGHFTSGGTVANIEALWRARYRQDHWLSLGAYEADTGTEQRAIMEIAMRGWDDFDKKRNANPVKDETLKQYSFVANSPWEATRRYERIFDEEFKGPVVFIPNSKHYSWQKAVSLLGLGEDAFWPIRLDEEGRISIADLRRKLERAETENRPVMMLVSVAGTTELGEVDPIDKIQDVLDEYRKKKGWDIWHHVDAAYGGFFLTVDGNGQTESSLSQSTLQSLRAISRADSVTLDPHKLGYVPYSCGAILVRDERHYLVSSFSAPYVGGKQKVLKWERTLEGSRSATGASATWLTAKVIGLGPDGLGRLLKRSIRAKDQLKKMMTQKIPHCFTLPGDDLNILCFCIADPGESISSVSEKSEALYHLLSEQEGFYVSKTQLGLKDYDLFLERFIGQWDGHIDSPSVTVVRLVLMNPFFTSSAFETDFPEAFVNAVKKVLKNTDETILQKN